MENFLVRCNEYGNLEMLMFDTLEQALAFVDENVNNGIYGEMQIFRNMNMKITISVDNPA